MTLDTSSFSAYLCSLNITTPVTTKSGRMVEGPPAPLFELALRLGLGPTILDTPRNRALVRNLGVSAETLKTATKHLRSRGQWCEVWEELAQPHISAVDAAIARNDGETAIQEIHTALGLIGVAYGGDGYYIHMPMQKKRGMFQLTRRLYDSLRELTGERVERLTFSHAHGSTAGLLHLPSSINGAQKYPALVGLHGAAGDKDSFDYTLRLFREAGYATFCIDLPAHGESFDGPRLQVDDEVVGAAALESLAAHPQIDPDRLGVIGGSLGAFFAQRTAAVSPPAKACLVFASPFDIGSGMKDAISGIQDLMMWIMGAKTRSELLEVSKPFHLRDVVGNIRCPVGIVHGTNDHICNFTASYEIARRLKSPVSVFPLIGVDHEAAQPSTPALASPGMGWLQTVL